MSQQMLRSDVSPLGRGLSWNLMVALLVLIQLALGLVYLKAVPRLMNDEAFEASLGYSLAFEGRIRTQVMMDCGGMHVHLVQNRLILPIVLAAIYRVTGFSITASRLGSVVVSVFALISICGVMRRWFGDKASIWIGAATILNPWFFEVSRRTRPEIYYMAFGMASLWCAAWMLERRTRFSGILTGFVAGLTCMVHPNGCVIVLAVASAMILLQGNRKMWRLCPWVILGFLIVLVPYVIYVLWAVRDPHVSFIGQMQACRDVGIEQRWADAPMKEIRRWARFVQWPLGAPLAVVFGAGALAALYRSSRADKTIVGSILLFVILVICTTSANLSPSARYLTACLPLLCALVVRLVQRLASIDPERGRRTRPRTVLALIIAGIYAASCLGGISVLFYRLRTADLTPTLRRIAANTGPDGRIYGRTLLWMGCNLYHYGPFYGYDPNLKGNTIELVREAGFDYVVRSAWNFDSSGGFSGPPQNMPPFSEDDAIDQLCERYGVELDAFHDPNFGPIEVYRLDWTKDEQGTSSRGERVIPSAASTVSARGCLCPSVSHSRTESP